MDNEKELKEVLKEELAAFKKTLPEFQTKDEMKVAFDAFKLDISKQFENQVTKNQFKTIETAIEKQGEVLASMKLQTGGFGNSFKEMLIANQDEINKMVENNGSGRIEIRTTTKAVTSANVTSDTMAYRETQVGDIKRGMPYLRNMFKIVNLGGNTHGSIKWFEQLAITNNATNVAEATVTGSAASNLTWVEKTLSGKRIYDFIKVGIDQLKDVDFINGEVQRLIERNMRLKENAQLLSGTGIGNEIAGILTYAKEFVTTNISIQSANLVDLIGKCKTQIDNDMFGAAIPNYFTVNRTDVDNVRYCKTTEGGYVFPQWVMGDGAINVGNVAGVENPLIEANTLLVGDFSLATLYVWDDLVIEIAQIEDDKKTWMTTIIAYMRENLRVQDVDKNAFVKVSDINTTLDAISIHA